MKHNELTPVMVLDPNTGKTINIATLLHSIHHYFNGFHFAANEIVEMTENLACAINQHMPDSMLDSELSTHFYTLTILRRTFTEMPKGRKITM